MAAAPSYARNAGRPPRFPHRSRAFPVRWSSPPFETVTTPSPPTSADTPGPIPAQGPAATLADVLAALPRARLAPGAGAEPAAVALRDVTLDSREAAAGVLFACRPGARTDGHRFAQAAASAGAAALLVERPQDVAVPQVQVESVAQAVGEAAAVVHGHPSRDLLVAGVTGTNGKTTSAYLLESAFRAAGHRTGLIGTVQTLVAGQAQPGVRTTPEATDLQRLFARMRAERVGAVAMEVSSHGLALGRVRGVRFGVALFTNLTQDHLDFHADLEDYFAAKASLFDPAYTPRAVVNTDDPYGARLAAMAQERGLEVTRVSPSGAAGADARAVDVRLEREGSRFTAVLPQGAVDVALRLPGGFNVANALGVLAALVVLGMPPEGAAAGLGALDGVPGRMQRVPGAQPFTVLVDYAHTPDSVEHVLRAARELTAGRVIVVIGCGGDRDRGKRGPMGRAAAELADLAVFTADNPRSEDPEAILAAMAEGARATGGDWRVEVSRADAIRLALDAAGPGDVVVIAGKGHEATQEFADVTVPFDDRAVAAEILAERWGPAPDGGDAS